jgi:hypothetical protein
MNADRYTTPSTPSRTAVTEARRCHAGHVHTIDRVWSRRRFFKAAAGATAAVAVAGSGLLRPRSVAAAGPGMGLTEPIPATLELFPGVFGHVQAPPLTGDDTDPSTVNNFQGAAGIAFVSGLVERRNRRTGEVRTLPFLFNDMRFMKGVFRGRDGHERNATFAFI